MLQNYQQLVEKISRASGLNVADVERKVEAKCAKLSGLISKEGAAQIVASELGISFEKEKIKVGEAMSGMKRVNLFGKIVQLFPIREYNKNGKSGKIASMILADDTSSIRTVLWDTNHIKLFEDGKIKQGDVVEIGNASIRNDELHLSGFSDIKLSKEIIDSVKIEVKGVEKKIIDLKSGENVKLRAVLVQMFEPKFFEVCGECNKKAINGFCEAHGNIIPVRKALLSIVLDDGSECMRGVVFGEQLKALGFGDEELNNLEFFAKKKNEIIGMEANFSANVRNNSMFNTTELIVNGIEQIDLDNLIQNLRN